MIISATILNWYINRLRFTNPDLSDYQLDKIKWSMVNYAENVRIEENTKLENDEYLKKLNYE